MDGGYAGESNGLVSEGEVEAEGINLAQVPVLEIEVQGLGLAGLPGEENEAAGQLPGLDGQVQSKPRRGDIN